MNHHEDILIELNAISTTVAEVPRVNVFTVHAFYFANIEAELNARISADRLFSGNAFSVPEGYFEGLAGNIMQKIKAEEAEDIAPFGADTHKVNVFTVPRGYFEGLAELILQKIYAEEETALPAGLTKSNVFTVPQGYFEGLEKSILGRIYSEESSIAEMQTLSPMLAGIEKKNVFTVPQGYFAELGFINEAQPVAKVVQMNTVRSRSVFRYAAAAVITGLLGLSILNVMHKTSSPEVVNTVQLASLDAVKEGNNILTAGKFEQELAAVSEEDIDRYFAKEGRDVKAAMVAASIDNSVNLPDPTDYLFDENTLDNYLEENNLKD